MTAKTTINTAEQFLKAGPRQIKDVDIKGFGQVRIQKLLKSELCQFQKWLRPKGELNDDRYAQRDLYLIALSVVDDQGNPLFNVEQIDKLGSVDGQAMDELAYEVMIFNGYMEPIDVELLGKSDS